MGWGLFFVAMYRFLTAVTSLALGLYSLQSMDFRVQTRALWLLGMWDLPKPGTEPVSPTLAGRFLTPGPSGKSQGTSLKAEDQGLGGGHSNLVQLIQAR